MAGFFLQRKKKMSVTLRWEKWTLVRFFSCFFLMKIKRPLLTPPLTPHLPPPATKRVQKIFCKGKKNFTSYKKKVNRLSNRTYLDLLVRSSGSSAPEIQQLDNFQITIYIPFFLTLSWQNIKIIIIIMT